MAKILLNKAAGSSNKVYIIEHMEADEPPDELLSSLPPWVQLEYAHIANHVSAIFSSLSPSSAKVLQNSLAASSDSVATTEGIDSLLDGRHRNRFCLLDPKATQELSPEDAELFDGLLFGGILGDHPPRDRTGELRRLALPSRRLGPVQMTTDTAVLVSQLVLEKRKKLDEIDYIDEPEIQLNDERESVQMPFRYIRTDDGQPLLPQGMKEHLSKDLDRGFDDLL